MSVLTQGYFAYRYNKKYYRRFLDSHAEPSSSGQGFADTIPRDPSAFKEWVPSTIMMLENTKTGNEMVLHWDLYSYDPRDNPHDDWRFELLHDLNWTFVDDDIQYTYVIDLDNFVFTVNATTHLKLEDMPPSDPGFKAYFAPFNRVEIPPRHLTTAVKLWTAPLFDTAERQRQYEALHPSVTPAEEWGVLPAASLSFPQRVSIALTYHIIDQTSSDMVYAYVPSVRKEAGLVCWDVLCAATSSIPLCCGRIDQQLGRQERMLSPAPPGEYPRLVPINMISRVSTQFPKSFQRVGGDYCWVRGRLITFCLHLSDPAYVVHEVEQMVRRMRLDGPADCVGIILSSQQEMVAVAVDDGPGPARRVRHTPVLDIRPCPNKPAEASEGLRLMVQLLSPILTVPQLPWRAPSSRPSRTLAARPHPNLPPELLWIIIGYTTTPDYLSLCRVSREIRSACLSCPRYGNYTLLPKRPEGELMYAAKFVDDDEPTVISLYWRYRKWDACEVAWRVPEGSEDDGGYDTSSDDSEDGDSEEEDREEGSD
ncbi:hypothetical protein B0J17DRAFT_718603 [Rhizoctonia solani]|nr:hypothetical protein B0J17DRAFT_718603 [Rhizoctonia solani]